MGYEYMQPGTTIEEELSIGPDALGTECGEALIEAATRRVRADAAAAGIVLGRIEIDADHAGRCCRLRAQVIAPREHVSEDVGVETQTVDTEPAGEPVGEAAIEDERDPGDDAKTI